MKAVAVIPGKPNSIHLANLSKPSVQDMQSDAVAIMWPARFSSLAFADETGNMKGE